MKPRFQLVNVLIAKSMIETVFVAALAVAVYVNAFPPSFKGWGEAVPASRAIAGWGVSDSDPWLRLEVQLFVDGKLVERQIANQSRPDVSAAGWAKDEWHGYNFTVKGLAPGTHDARVYVLHASKNGARQTLQMLGDPITFQVNTDGSWSHE